MEPVFNPQQEERIKELMHNTLEEFFSNKGKTLKTFLITAATIVGSLTVIFGGIKVFLGWLGFNYLGK